MSSRSRQHASGAVPGSLHALPGHITVQHPPSSTLRAARCLLAVCVCACPRPPCGSDRGPVDHSGPALRRNRRPKALLPALGSSLLCSRAGAPSRKDLIVHYYAISRRREPRTRAPRCRTPGGLALTSTARPMMRFRNVLDVQSSLPGGLQRRADDSEREPIRPAASEGGELNSKETKHGAPSALARQRPTVLRQARDALAGSSAGCLRDCSRPARAGGSRRWK